MGRPVYRIGIVVSDKMDKTRVVIRYIYKMHPKYKKYMRKITKYYVHDEHNVSKVGDIVKIRYVRPLSKLKRWKLVEIVKRAEEVRGQHILPKKEENNVTE